MDSEEYGALDINPMDQFLVRSLFGGEISWYTPTNMTLWMALTIVAASALMIYGARGRALVPSRAQSAAEMTYLLVHNMVRDVAGQDAVRFFPYIFTLFMFVLFSNLLGLIPFAFTSTAHIAVTAVLALTVFLSVTALGFLLNGSKFLGLFWVSSAPAALRPVLALIELISYFARPISHSIRLAGAMMAGHAVAKVFAGFAAALGAAFFVPVLAVTALYALELLVAVIQAYVFTILTCVYLRDALHPSH